MCDDSPEANLPFPCHQGQQSQVVPVVVQARKDMAGCPLKWKYNVIVKHEMELGSANYEMSILHDYNVLKNWTQILH
jgi:hypothetical protein